MRPDGWEEAIDIFMLSSPELQASGRSQRDTIFFEAGADAYEAGLKKEGIYNDAIYGFNGNNIPTNWLSSLHRGGVMIRKQIRELIDTYCDGKCLFVESGCEYKHENGWCIESDSCYNCLMKHLGELGVVLKVDIELPIHELSFPDAYTANLYREGSLAMLKAGYVAVESLIKEGR